MSESFRFKAVSAAYKPSGRFDSAQFSLGLILSAAYVYGISWVFAFAFGGASWLMERYTWWVVLPLAFGFLSLASVLALLVYKAVALVVNKKNRNASLARGIPAIATFVAVAYSLSLASPGTFENGFLKFFAVIILVLAPIMIAKIAGTLRPYCEIHNKYMTESTVITTDLSNLDELIAALNERRFAVLNTLLAEDKPDMDESLCRLLLQSCEKDCSSFLELHTTVVLAGEDGKKNKSNRRVFSAVLTPTELNEIEIVRKYEWQRVAESGKEVKA